MYLSPWKIHFTKCLGEETAEKLTYGSDIDKLTKEYMTKRKLPKLQVAEKDGNFFTLDNTRLQIFRKLYEQGKCKTIKVERVAIGRVPEGILNLMTIDENKQARQQKQNVCSHNPQTYTLLPRCLPDYQAKGASGSKRLSRETSADERQPSTDSGVQRDADDNDSLSSFSLDSDAESVDSMPPSYEYYYYSYESSTDASTESEVEEEEESLI